MSDGNDILMSGGLETVKFPVAGTTVEMLILGLPEKKQQTNKKGEPESWPDGNPRWVVIVPVRIDLARFPAQRDASNPDDRGERSWWIGGYMTAAVRTAIRAAGAQGLDVGGLASVTYTGDGQATARGIDPPKLYSAHYLPPSAGNTALMGSTQESVQPGSVYQTPGFAPQTHAAMQAQYVPATPPPTYAPQGTNIPGYTVPAAPVSAPAPQLQYGATMASLQPEQVPGNGNVPPPPPGVDPAGWAVTWARLTQEQRQQVLSQMAMASNAPPF